VDISSPKASMASGSAKVQNGDEAVRPRTGTNGLRARQASAALAGDDVAISSAARPQPGAAASSPLDSGSASALARSLRNMLAETPELAVQAQANSAPSQLLSLFRG
jgi:hypothetical protein